jgi:hypothetical protein
MREIRDHVVTGDLPQNQLTVMVTDEPGAGGASHRYEITGLDTHYNPSEIRDEEYLKSTRHIILFQNGPIQEAGINGVTQEVLLAIVRDRLRSFQAGPYPCEENALALSATEYALAMLKRRTKKRLARGVEGRTQP